MPMAVPIIVAGVTAAAGAALAGTTILGLGVAASAALIGLVGAGLAAVNSFLAPEPEKPKIDGGFAQEATGLTVEIRAPVVSRRLIYGEARVGGILVAAEASNNNNDLWMVFALCEGPVDAIPIVLLDDYPIYPDDLDGDGNVTSGRYAGKLQIRKHLGATDQAADTSIGIGGWGSNHRLRGVSYLAVKFTYDRDVYGSGRPNVSAVVRGLKPGDPRDSTTGWTANASLCIRDYLLRTDAKGGYGAASDEVRDSAFNTAANLSDEIVQTVEDSHTVNTVQVSDDALDLNDEVLKFQTGDRLKLTTSGSLPGGLSGGSTRYYAIVVHIRQRSDSGSVTRRCRMQLAATLDDAYAGTAVAISSEGSGTHTVTKDGEPRYTINGVVDTAKQPETILREMLTSIAGRLVWTGGEFVLHGGAWIAPTITYDEDDFRGGIVVATKHSKRDRYNGLKGTFTSPQNLWQPQTYPAITSSTFETEDNGERILHDYDQPFNSRGSACQRVASIELFRHRNQTRATFPLKMTGIRMAAGGTFAIDYDRRGWSGRSFEAAGFTFTTVDTDGGPALGTILEGAALNSTDFDWNHATDEQPVNTPSPSSLPDPFDVDAPTSLVVRTETVGVSPRLVLTWAPPDNVFVTQDGNFEVAFRRATGRALSFDGTDDYVATVSQIDLDNLAGSPSEFSIETWLQWAGGAGDQTVFNNGQIRLYVRDSDSKLVAELTAAGSPESIATIVSGSAMTANAWTHVAVTWDGATKALYVDGTSQGTALLAGPLAAANAALDLGRGNGAVRDTDHFGGALDDFRIWSDVRSGTEIAENRGSPLKGDEAGLRLYWPFDVVNANYALDSGPSGLYGEINGAGYGNGQVTPDYEPAQIVDGSQQKAYIAPVEVDVGYDMRVRSRNALGAVSAWSTILNYNAGSPAEGATSAEDWGLFSEPLTDGVDDWGLHSQPTTELRDWEDFV